MVTVTHRADATATETDRTDRHDGRDRVIKTVTLSHPTTVELVREFPTGHVNLEAYTTSMCPDYVAEDLQHAAPDGVEIDGRTVESRISGHRDEWITQARRYISERPNMDVMDALEMFARWDDTRGVSDAIDAVENGDVDDLSPLVPDDPRYDD